MLTDNHLTFFSLIVLQNKSEPNGWAYAVKRYIILLILKLWTLVQGADDVIIDVGMSSWTSNLRKVTYVCCHLCLSSVKAKNGQTSQAGKKDPSLPDVRSFKEHTQRRADLRKQRVREYIMYLSYQFLWQVVYHCRCCCVLCQFNCGECFVVGGATGEAENVETEGDDEEEKSGHFPERRSATTESVWTEGWCSCHPLMLRKHLHVV